MAKELFNQELTEYSRGTNQPLAMKALLNLLNELNDDEIVKIMKLEK